MMDSAVCDGFAQDERTPTKPKNRSFSGPAAETSSPVLAPPADIIEHRASKDDHAVPTTPKPGRRPELLARGLSLQMPSPAQFPRPMPLSPQLDPRDIYTQNENLAASPATSIPRHSRGLDFSRACTTLHHSTLAEQSSPDSSPVITQKAMAIPGRNGSISSMVLDSPNLQSMNNPPWASLPTERSTVSSSLGSVNMLGSESESSSSDDDVSMGGDLDDAVYATPQVHKLQNPNISTPLNGSQTPAFGAGAATWGIGSMFSPAQASLMKTIRRNRLHKDPKRARKRSSSASGSGYSSMASPRTTSPPPLKSIETTATGTTGGGYFHWTAARSRRESLAMNTEGLHLSSGNDSGDEASQHLPTTPAVIKRPVVRRGNLLPKTKGFARIRAALAEEATPVDTESRREAETIKQVRERDNSVPDLDSPFDRSGTATAGSSPNLLPAVPESAQEDFGRDLDSDGNSAKGLGMNFAAHASRNSGGLDYWNRFDPAMRTPPPPATFTRQSSTVASDVNMDSPLPSVGEGWRRPRARSSASDASEAMGSVSNPTNTGQGTLISDDMHLKKFKRRREDDFDIATIKRRAVSPGMSSQNSPVLTHSPSSRDGLWGQPPDRKKENLPPSAGSDTSQPQSSARANSITGAFPGKKLGLQGMVDTNDGISKMSIDA